jgi:hypothetical protein
LRVQHRSCEHARRCATAIARKDARLRKTRACVPADVALRDVERCARAQQHNNDRQDVARAVHCVHSHVRNCTHVQRARARVNVDACKRKLVLRRCCKLVKRVCVCVCVRVRLRFRTLNMKMNRRKRRSMLCKRCALFHDARSRHEMHGTCSYARPALRVNI